MQSPTIDSLVARRDRVRERWETLLRGERVGSPLARPEFLVPLIDRTLDDIFRHLREIPLQGQGKRNGGRLIARAQCACGRNPLLVYFICGEQALLEELIHLQSEATVAESVPAQRATDLTELFVVLRRVAQQEVEAFCSLCLHRVQSPRGRARAGCSSDDGAARDKTKELLGQSCGAPG